MIRKKPQAIPKDEFCRAYDTFKKDLLPAYDKYEDEKDEKGYSDYFDYN